MKLNQAILEGYTHCTVDDEDETSWSLLEISEHPEELEEGRNYVLIDKEPRFMTVSPEYIDELLSEDIDNTEEFPSEDLSIYALEGCDELIKILSDKINMNLSRRKFFFHTDIPLEL